MTVTRRLPRRRRGRSRAQRSRSDGYVTVTQRSPRRCRGRSRGASRSPGSKGRRAPSGRAAPTARRARPCRVPFGTTSSEAERERNDARDGRSTTMIEGEVAARRRLARRGIEEHRTDRRRSDPAAVGFIPCFIPSHCITLHRSSFHDVTSPRARTTTRPPSAVWCRGRDAVSAVGDAVGDAVGGRCRADDDGARACETASFWLELCESASQPCDLSCVARRGRRRRPLRPLVWREDRRNPHDSFHSIPFHSVPFHCIALHCIALHCIALHCILLHFIELHFFACYCIAVQCSAVQYSTVQKSSPVKLSTTTDLQ